MSTLLDLISSRLIGVKRGADSTIQSQCPVCAADGRDAAKVHLRVWPNGSFSCAAHQGDKEHNTLIRRAIRGDSTTELSLILSGDLDEYIDPEPRPDVVKVYEEALLEKLTPDRTYWVGRGVKPEVLSLIGGGVASMEERSKLSGRYVLPCRDAHGRIIGWAGRRLNDDSFGPKWKLLGKKAFFCFPPVAVSDPAIQARSEAILVESQGCCLSLASAGFNNTICLFGTSLSSKVLGRLIGLAPRRILIATNNESSGIGNKAADEIYRALSRFIGEDHLRVALPPVKDFGMMTEEEIHGWYAALAAPLEVPVS